jgi:signal transduction histidine kinase
VGSLAASLAHEINNPLAVVLANVEEGARALGDLATSTTTELREEFTELRTMLEEAHSAAQRVQGIVRDLRVFACADDRRGRVDINAVIKSCCNLAIAEIRHRARLAMDFQATVPVFGSEARLAQLFLHLLVNAAHAMPEGDVRGNQIVVTTRQQGRAAVDIEICDSGSGIAPGNENQVFEPFYTTKPRRLGMGLTICHAIVTAQGGEIAVQPREGGGTIVHVRLPTCDLDGLPLELGRRHHKDAQWLGGS